MGAISDWIIKKLKIQESVDESVYGYLNDIYNGKDVKLSELKDDLYYNTLNQTLYEGNVEDLLFFYKNYSPSNFNSEDVSIFWNKAILDKRLPKIHIPLTKQITDFMPGLLFNNVPKYSVSTGNKSLDKNINKIVSKVLEDNDFENLIKHGAILESYSGAIAAKFIIDTKFSTEPIIVLYPKGSIKVRYAYDKVYEIVFIDMYDKGKETYRLESTYGKGYIKYKLFDTVKNKEVPLSTINETSDLVDIYVTQNGKPYNKLLCAYKVNKPGTIEGESDYNGIYSLQEALDALASYRELYFKYGSRVKTVVTEDQLEKDVNGNTIIKDYENNGLDILVLKDKNINGTDNKRDTLVPTLSQQAFEEAMTDISKKIINAAGLSLVSFGLEQSGRNASAEQMAIREAVNYRTREKKLSLWREFIEDLMELSLVYKTIMTDTNGTNIFNVPEFKYSYIVQFPDARQKSDLERAQYIQQLESTGYITHEDALRMYYDPVLESDELEEKIQIMMGIYNENKQLIQSQMAANQDSPFNKTPGSKQVETNKNKDEDSAETEL